MKEDVKRFEALLASIDLSAYRAKYAPIKIVEMDMPKNVQAIALLYQVYWKERQFLTYELFYARYLSELKAELEIFRQKTTMCEDCFYRGLPARIYRTWASIITQIHGGYIAESVFGYGTVSMSSELDHGGADFQVQYQGQVLNYQVKKTTYSREVRKEKEAKKNVLPGKFINISYEVFTDALFSNPTKKDGGNRVPYQRFLDNKNIRRLPNGFILFTTNPFEAEKALIDGQV